MRPVHISVITINYNQSKLTDDFIKSVIKYTPKTITYEFIIVDNCSNIDDYKKLQELIKALNIDNIKLIRSKVNLGFGGGNMLGVQFSKGKNLAFINNDIVFTEDCFSSLINHHDNNSNCGVSTPQQYNIDGKPTSCFDYFHGIRKEMFGRKFIELTSSKIKRENKHYKEVVSADFIQGCFMFFPTHIFSLIGGFDTNIFLYYEEMDICYRLSKINYTSELVPETSFKHLHGGSTNPSFMIKKELKISQLYISRKHHNYLKYLAIKSLVLVKTILRALTTPAYWSLVTIIFTGRYIENSLKQKQKINFES